MAAAGLLMLFGLTPAASGVDSPPPDPVIQVSEAAVRALTDREQAADSSSRSLPREPADLALPTEPPPEPEPETSDPPAEESADEAEQASIPEPIGWLNERQMEHAATIVRVGQEMGLPEQAYVIALATAMQESTLRVLANPVYPESYDLPHDGEGWDHDSVGLFQQRPVSGWGTVEDCMDPKKSAKKFYSSLRNVPNWEELPLTVAAQEVQGSAFPDHYAKHEGKAKLVVESILEWQAEKNGK